MSEPEAAGGHGGLMDAVYRHQRHIYDATRKYYLLGRDRLITQLKPPPNARVLEVGCGTGRNLILAARRYPNARFYGFDISEAMLETARAKIERAGLSDRVTIAQGDATDFSTQAMFGEEAVERAFCSYTLSMIPDWQAAIACSLKALTPDGEFHAVDFGQLERMPMLAKKALDKWLAVFHVTPRAALRDVLEQEAAAAGRQLDFTQLYRGYSWAAVVR